jgi:hypothetical protein
LLIDNPFSRLFTGDCNSSCLLAQKLGSAVFGWGQGQDFRAAGLNLEAFVSVYHVLPSDISIKPNPMVKSCKGEGPLNRGICTGLPPPPPKAITHNLQDMAWAKKWACLSSSSPLPLLPFPSSPLFPPPSPPPTCNLLSQEYE